VEADDLQLAAALLTTGINRRGRGELDLGSRNCCEESVHYLVLVASVTHGRAVLIQADRLQGGDRLHIAQLVQLVTIAGRNLARPGAPSCWAGAVDGSRVQVANMLSVMLGN
jgi:hypothetical protein